MISCKFLFRVVPYSFAFKGYQCCKERQNWHREAHSGGQEEKQDGGSNVVSHCQERAYIRQWLQGSSTGQEARPMAATG